LNPLLLLRLAPFIVAALLAIPSTATAAELAPSCDATGITARFALSAKAVFTRGESRAAVRRLQTTPVSSAAPVLLSLHGALLALAAPEPPVSTDASVSVRQPPVRAPPALS
jgi:hypothetical protein